MSHCSFLFFAAFCFLSLCLPVRFSEKLEIQALENPVKTRIEEKVAAGKYSFEDLMEAGKILLGEKKWLEAQKPLEVAQEIKPRDLGIKKALSRIYQETGQMDKLAALAKSVSSYLLPGGKEDDFYETMLTLSIRLHARENEEFAWSTFLKLFTTLKDKPGRLSRRIQELEPLTYVPFLSRIYQFLEDRKIYDDFLWGRVGDYFLVQGEFSRAVYFLEKEMEKEEFDYVYLYSQALAFYSLRQFTKAHIFSNLALALNKDEKVKSKIKSLQRALEDHSYSFSWDEVRTEADYYFQFSEKPLGLSKLKELLLGSTRNPQSLVAMGKILLGYPEEWQTWNDGRDFLLQYLESSNPDFDLLLECARVLYQKGYIEELTPILGKMEEIDPNRAANSEDYARFQKEVARSLHEDFQLMEARAEDSELKGILKLLIRFNPSLKEPYISLGSLVERQAARYRKSPGVYPQDFQNDVESVIVLFEKSPPRLWGSAQFQYFIGKFYGFLSSSKRQYSREIAHLKRALQKKPKFQAARVGLAQVYLDSGFFRQAFHQAEKALQMENLSDSLGVEARGIARKAYRESASQAYGEENYFLVLDYLQKAYLLNNEEPLDRESSLWYANSLVYAEQFEKGDLYLKGMLKRYGEDPEIYYLLALSSEGVYKLKDAAGFYQKAIDVGEKGNLFVEQCRKNLEHLNEIMRNRALELGNQ